MCQEKAGNVVVISGNNLRKTEYIEKAVAAGFNVLADKPMAITPEGFKQLCQTFELAERKHVLLYDIMTERYEITIALQRELARMPELFGTFVPGTPEDPGGGDAERSPLFQAGGRQAVARARRGSST